MTARARPTEQDRRTAVPTEWAESDELLVRRQICRTTSLETIRNDLSVIFYPARIETVDDDTDFQTSSLSATRVLDLTIGFLRFGSDVVVDPGALGSYHVNIPTAGSVTSECGPRHVTATVRQGAVFTPREYTTLPHWSSGTAQVCVKLAKSAVESELEGLLGHPVAGDIGFDLGFDLTTPRAQSWLAALRMFVAEVDRPGSLLDVSPCYRRHVERLLIDGLLWAQPHGFTDELTREDPPARPRTVKRVIDLIEADPRGTYSLADLARHAGVGARRLQRAFQDTLQTTPTAYQRKIKLAGARAELLAGEGSVTTVAYRWGFSHPGRFASYYRQTYGESPSDTLRRRS